MTADELSLAVSFLLPHTAAGASLVVILAEILAETRVEEGVEAAVGVAHQPTDDAEVVAKGRHCDKLPAFHDATDVVGEPTDGETNHQDHHHSRYLTPGVPSARSSCHVRTDELCSGVPQHGSHAGIAEADHT